MNRSRPLTSFWVAGILVLPIVLTIIKSTIQAHQDNFTFTIFLLNAGVPLLLLLGFFSGVFYSLYRRRKEAYIVLMCFAPFGISSAMALVFPATSSADLLGTGTTSSLVLALKVVSFIAIFAVIEYLIGKDLSAVRRSQRELSNQVIKLPPNPEPVEIKSAVSMNKLASLAPRLVLPSTIVVDLVGLYIFFLLFQDIPAWGYPNSGFQLLLVFPIFIITGTFTSVQLRLMAQAKDSNFIGIIWTLFSITIVLFLITIVAPHFTNSTSLSNAFGIFIYVLCIVLLLTLVAAFIGYVLRIVHRNSSVTPERLLTKP